MNAASSYLSAARELLDRLEQTEMPAVEAAAEICATSIAKGGLVFLFGNGHSRMMCEEMTPRQGCYAGFVALVEMSLSNHAAIVGANGLETRFTWKIMKGMPKRS
jgi:uncharacterized phosphosugar-binding protein